MTVEEVHRVLRQRGHTVAVAESLTAGLLCAALAETPGASATLRGGVVVYATDLKHVLAGVPRSLLDAHGPVSAEVAEALADGVAQRLGSTYGLSVTGVAGPGDQDGVPVGTVYAGVAGPEGSTVRALSLTGDRRRIRDESVAAALRLLATTL